MNKPSFNQSKLQYLGYLFLLFPIFAFSFLPDPIDQLLEKILSQSKKYMDEYTQEKVYLHFDKPYYAKGDDLWFKAYLTAGAFHQPSPLSQNLYVELLSIDSGIVERKILHMEKGFGDGSFALPDSLPSGDYQVRAYTHWMRNFDPDFIFRQDFKIEDPEAAPESIKNIVVDVNKIDLQFFPEGGDWVVGTPSLIAYKAVDALGQGAPVSGVIVNSNLDTLTRFEDFHLGMGAISLFPKSGEQYKAIIALPNGNTAEFPLPAPKNEGIAMSVQNTAEDFIRLTLRSNVDLNNPEVLIIGHVRGAVQFVGKGDLSAGAFAAKIPRSNFSEGIVTLTVFDSKGQAIAERLLFNHTGKRLHVQLTADKASYGQREKVTLQLKVSDQDGAPLAANLSLAVNDLGQVTPRPHQRNIYNYLLLTSDLKGEIEQPNWYFEDDSGEKRRMLDFLMMTQGWRRFQWEALLEDEFPEVAYFIEQGLMVKGKVTREYSKKPASNGKVTLFIKDSTTAIYTGRTGENGNFFFPDLKYGEQTPMVLQAENEKGKKFVDIYLDEPVPPIAAEITLQDDPARVSEELATYLQKAKERRKIERAFRMDDLIMLEGVEISGQRSAPEDQITRIYGKGDVVIRPEDSPGSIGMIHPLQLIQGRVAGVRVTGNGINYSVTIRGIGSINSSTTPLILLDNVPVDISVLNTLSVQDIATVEVFKDPGKTAIFGSNGSNGAIAFYTKTGNGISETGKKGIINFLGKGYAKARVFYSPNYGEKKQKHAMPDRRSTLFWQPQILVDSTGRAEVSFYTSDVDTELGVMLEGLSELGHAGAGSSLLKVE